MPGIEYSSGGTPVMVGSPQVGSAPLDQPAKMTPFRQATLERSDLVGVDTLTQTASEQVVERVLPGTGYVYGWDIEYKFITAGNAATVAFAEDGPYNACSAFIFRDVNGELINMDGWSLKSISRFGGWELRDHETSLDTNFVWLKTSGAGATGGSFLFHLTAPIALNRRTLLGLVGNQDRGQAYQMKHNLAATTTVFTTPPTTPATGTISRIYESYAVPNPSGDQGGQNQVFPPFYGVIPYLTKSISANAPIGGSAVNHYLQRLNTTFRALLLAFRQNGSRVSAEPNLPTNITLKIGNQSIFNETPDYRRKLMFDRYGFVNVLSGVLVYDMLHDFAQIAAAELGNDWYWTQQLTEAQFICTYPSAFGSTANTLTVVTSDMVVPQGMNLYAA